MLDYWGLDEWMTALRAVKMSVEGESDRVFCPHLHAHAPQIFQKRVCIQEIPHQVQDKIYVLGVPNEFKTLERRPQRAMSAAGKKCTVKGRSASEAT